jgi:hypothetical protein
LRKTSKGAADFVRNGKLRSLAVIIGDVLEEITYNNRLDPYSRTNSNYSFIRLSAQQN